MQRQKEKNRKTRHAVLLLLLVLTMLFVTACGNEKNGVAEPADPPETVNEATDEPTGGLPDEPADETDDETTDSLTDEPTDDLTDEEQQAAEEREQILASIDSDVQIDDKTPYSIMVNRQENCVTIYTLDNNSEYTIPVKAMVCSAGREGHRSPLGEYAVMDFKAEWCYMVDGSYGQYATGWREGGYLFHSACYSKQSKDSLMIDEYNMLGENASLGCIRLQVADAKWIYDNCMVGTPVTIYEDDNPGPLGKPETVIPFIDETMDNGWDPTDPDEENPWRMEIEAEL